MKAMCGHSRLDPCRLMAQDERIRHWPVNQTECHAGVSHLGQCPLAFNEDAVVAFGNRSINLNLDTARRTVFFFVARS